AAPALRPPMPRMPERSSGAAYPDNEWRVRVRRCHADADHRASTIVRLVLAIWFSFLCALYLYEVRCGFVLCSGILIQVLPHMTQNDLPFRHGLSDLAQ